MTVFRYELKKLLVLLKSDSKSLMAGIIAPTVILLVFFLTLGNFTSFKLAVINQDDGPAGQALEQSIFRQVSPLGHQPYFKKVTANAREAAALYEADRINGIVVIPHDFSQSIKTQKPANITYTFNNYHSDMAKNLRLYLDEGILDFQRQVNPGIQALQVTEVHQVKRQIDWFAIIAVSVYMLAFLMGAMFNFLYLFQKEKTYGTLFAYHLSPKNIIGSFGARVTIALLAGVITSSVNALFIYLLTGINLLLFADRIAIIMLCLGLSYIFLSCLIGLAAKSFNGSAVFSMVLAVLLWFLSGATASVNYATGTLKTIALCIPNTYALAQIRDIVFDMQMTDLNPRTGWLIMLLYMLSLMSASLYMYRKKLNRKIN